jgi:Carboxypeptidase regulatory-like domain
MEQVRKFRVWIGLCLALVLLLGIPPTSQAQTNKGSISGVVLDSQGATVPNADVRVVNKDTGETGASQSDSAGLFRINLLTVGNYRVEISKGGFRKIVLDGVSVDSAQDHGLGSLKLEIGDVSTTIEVSAATPLVDVTEAQISTSFGTATLNTMPTISANQGLDNLATYVPGVSSSRQLGFSNSNGGGGFAVEGIRGRNNDQQIDGQYNNDNSVGGPGLFLSDSQFVQEYQITTNNMSAEYGRNSGSVVNILTKSGGNTVHGSIYGTEGNAGFDTLFATDKEFNGLTQVPHYNDAFAGATVGGAMVKDKLFYFGGFNTEIIHQTNVYATGNLTPTPVGIAELEACYPYTDPATGLPGIAPAIQVLTKYGPFGILGGNPIPQGITTKTYPIPGSTNLCTVEESGVQRTLPTGSHQYNWIYKMDLNTAKNRFYGRYIYNYANFFNADPFATAAAGYPTNEPGLGQQYGFSWVRTITDRQTNEFRASYGRENFGFGGNSIGNTVPSAAGITDALAHVGISASGSLGFGPATNAPQGRIVNSYQFQDNWSYVRGRHALKAGVNYTYQRSPNFFLPNVNGSYTYSSFATLAQNTARAISVTAGNPILDFREHDSFLYVQDDYKLKNNLTLNLGLTWSYYGQPANLFHDKTTKQQAGSQPFWDPTLPTSVTTFPSIPAPKASFGPNVGFAWTPGGREGILGRTLGNNKTTIRGGYRYAYDPPFYNIYLNIASAAPNALAQTIRPTPGNPLPSIPTAPFGPAVRSSLSNVLVFGVKDPRTFNQTTITPDFGPQKTSRWSLGVQRELSSAAAIEARYVGNHATNLYQSVNANPFIAGIAADFPNLIPSGITPCTTPTIPSALGRVNCNEGVIRQRTNSAYSDYNGVEIEFRTNNLWHQLTMRANYTYSKATDNADEIFGTFGTGSGIAFSQNPLNFRGQEHGLSGLDFPHQLNLLFVEQLPFFRGQHSYLGHVLGGWGASAGWHLASGQPYTPSQIFLAQGSGSPYIDTAFNSAFAGFGTGDGGIRPFIGSSSAIVTQIGMFAGDACNYAGVGCGFAANQLISLNSINTNPNDTVGVPVTKSSVRLIANGPVADQVFGTPFGNAARNSLRAAKINNVDLSVFKNIKFWERVNLQMHLDATNVFNHTQPNNVDPFIDDAGLNSFETGFGNPQLFPSNTQTSNRIVRIGLLLNF